GHAIGGMGAINDAIAREARARGATSLTDSPVACVTARRGAGTGSARADGTGTAARGGGAKLHPQMLCLPVGAAPAVDPDFRRRIEAYRCSSGTFRMNVALEVLPSFECLPGDGPHLRSGIIIAPSLGYMESAYFDARRLGWSREPIIEMLIPSLVD